MKQSFKLCLSLGLLFGFGLSPVSAYASWDPYENLRIALGNWTPTTIFKIESSDVSGENYKFIKGDSTQIFLELEKKKAELLFFKKQIKQLEDCRVQSCLKIVENTEGTTTNIALSVEEIGKALEKLNTEFTTLDRFITYAEKKLVEELPKIKLALEVEILGGKTELKDLKDNIKNMINSGEVVPIGKASEYFEIKTPDTWNEGNPSFQFAGTAIEVKDKLQEAQLEVSNKFEELTGIKAIFSENGNSFYFDVSRVSNNKVVTNDHGTYWIGIQPDTPQAEIDAYAAIKGVMFANFLANEKIIDAALFKPVDQRTDLEKNVIKASLEEAQKNLEIQIKQRESTIRNAQIGLTLYSPTLLQEKNDLISGLESAELDVVSKQKLETRIQYIDEYLADLSDYAQGRTNSDCSSGVCSAKFDGGALEIARLAQRISELAPESAQTIIKTVSIQSIEQANYEVESRFLESKLAEANLALNYRIKEAEEWQNSAVSAAQESIQQIVNDYNARKDAVQKMIISVTNEYIASGTDPALAQQMAESKFDGILPQLQGQEKVALEGASQWYESLNQGSLSDIAISKFGLDQVQDKIESIEKEIKSLTVPGIE